MVRFSDLLGGNETPDEEPAAADPADRAEPAAADDDSPEDVLERLTQFATSARATDSAPPPPAPPPAAGAPPSPPAPEPPTTTFRDAGATDPVPDAEADTPAALTPQADDLLPRAKGKKRRG